MAIWDFRPRGDVLTGVAVGVGVLAAPLVVPLAWSAVRPLIKALLKGGFLLYETGRGSFADAGEGADRETAKTTAPAKAPKADERAKATHEEELLLEQKVEHVKEPKAMQAPEKAAHEKPKRPPRTAKKKAEKEKLA